MDARKSVSIIIHNYNGKHLLQEYLPYTCRAIIHAGIPYEIIIVDDCSKDDSANFIKSAYPQVKLIVNPQNKGFSYSCNYGIDAAQYDLIFLLNSGVKLSPNYFDEQWKYFLRWDTFGVMGRIIDMEGDRILQAARMPKVSCCQIQTDYQYYSDNDGDRIRTWQLPVANALISAEKLKKAGGFYTLFETGYGAGSELSLRALRLNWKCYFENQAACFQKAGDCKKDQEYYLDRYLLHAIHLEGVELFIWHLRVIFADLIPKFLSGQTWIWQSYQAIYRNKDAIKQYKAEVKKLMDENDTRLGLSDIVKRINASVKNKTVHRFKYGCD